MGGRERPLLIQMKGQSTDITYRQLLKLGYLHLGEVRGEEPLEQSPQFYEDK